MSNLRNLQVLSNAESTFAKSTAMGELPFTISSELSDKLQNLRNSKDYNLIEMNIIDEEVRYVSDHLTNGSDISQYVHADEPR